MPLNKLKCLSAVLVALAFITACGHGDHSQKRYITSVEEPSDYRAHPASYVVDRFSVRREIEVREPSPIPFYYQKCSRNVGTFIGSNTAFECN